MRSLVIFLFISHQPSAPSKGRLETLRRRAITLFETFTLLPCVVARTGRREKGGVGSKDNKLIGAYGRDIHNDNGELLLSFANNHDLAIVNTFFSTPKGGVSHTFNGRGKKRIDYILTRQRDRKFVRNVTVHPQPSFLPISDHNIVSAPTRQAPRSFCPKPPAEGLS